MNSSPVVSEIIFRLYMIFAIIVLAKHINFTLLASFIFFMLSQRLFKIISLLSLDSLDIPAFILRYLISLLP